MVYLLAQCSNLMWILSTRDFYIRQFLVWIQDRRQGLLRLSALVVPLSPFFPHLPSIFFLLFSFSSFKFSFSSFSMHKNCWGFINIVHTGQGHSSPLALMLDLHYSFHGYLSRLVALPFRSVARCYFPLHIISFTCRQIQYVYQHRQLTQCQQRSLDCICIWSIGIVVLLLIL